jgi:flagellar protein FlaI
MLRIPKVASKSRNISKREIIRRFKAGYRALKKKKGSDAGIAPTIIGLGGLYFGKPGAAEEEKKQTEPEDGVEISGLSKPSLAGMGTGEEKSEELKGINIYYPLNPADPKKGEVVFAYASLKWEPKTNEIVYNVIEPKTTPADEEIIKKIKKLLEERLDVDFTKLGEIKAKGLLKKEIEKLLSAENIKNEPRSSIIRYYIERDILGLGKIDALIRDANIEDISTDGTGVPIFVYHRDPRFGSIRTSIVFPTKDELDDFVVRLAQKCNKTISVAEPLMDASLPDGSRVQATLGTDIARKGSNFTIRKFTEKPLTPVHMLKYKTLDSMQLAYLWLAIENGKTILISGGTATGKTSLLNALSLFIKPTMKVVSIEDTAELRLPLPHWIPHVARTPLAVKEKIGDVTLFDLLRSSLRQRPDYIIVGEVRGKEASVMFQQIASITGDQKVLVLNDDHMKRVPIGNLEYRNGFKVPALNPDTNRIELFGLGDVIKHAPVTEVYKITTKSGREVTATGNHSLFMYDGEVKTCVASEIKIGNGILVPSKLPAGYTDLEYLNLVELLPDIRVYAPDIIKRASRKLGFERASKIAGFTTISNYYGVNNCALPAERFLKLAEEAGIEYNIDDITVRFGGGGSTKMKAKLRITPELLRFFGYQISEGSINTAKRNNSIALYNSNSALLEDMKRCISMLTNGKINKRDVKGFGRCKELRFNNKTIFEIIRRFSGEKSRCKRVPDFIFGLSREKIGHFLSGLFAGDSMMNSKRFVYYSSSKELINDVSLLLLSLNVFGRISSKKTNKDSKTKDFYTLTIQRKRDKLRFLEYVSPIGKNPDKIKNELLTSRGFEDKNFIGDFYIDKVRSIERVKTPPTDVFDLSVPNAQNFIGGFGGVLLHNTGHAALSTIHAASIPQLIDRLITPPISLPPNLLENIDVIIFLVFSKLRGVYVRRANSILEVMGVDKDRPVSKEIFAWRPAADSFETVKKSSVMKKIAERIGVAEETIKQELTNRKKVLEWMFEEGIFDYRDVAKVINSYYTNPEAVLTMVTK